MEGLKLRKILKEGRTATRGWSNTSKNDGEGLKTEIQMVSHLEAAKGSTIAN